MTTYSIHIPAFVAVEMAKSNLWRHATKEEFQKNGADAYMSGIPVYVTREHEEKKP